VKLDLWRCWSSPIRLVEISSDHPAHFDAKTVTLIAIDRIFGSSPGWVLPIVCSSFACVSYPRSLHLRGVIDHAPVAWYLSVRAPLPRDALPFPQRIS